MKYDIGLRFQKIRDPSPTTVPPAKPESWVASLFVPYLTPHIYLVTRAFTFRLLTSSPSAPHLPSLRASLSPLRSHTFSWTTTLSTPLKSLPLVTPCLEAVIQAASRITDAKGLPSRVDASFKESVISWQFAQASPDSLAHHLRVSCLWRDTSPLSPATFHYPGMKVLNLMFIFFPSKLYYSLFSPPLPPPCGHLHMLQKMFLGHIFGKASSTYFLNVSILLLGASTLPSEDSLLGRKWWFTRLPFLLKHLRLPPLKAPWHLIWVFLMLNPAPAIIQALNV